MDQDKYLDEIAVAYLGVQQSIPEIRSSVTSEREMDGLLKNPDKEDKLEKFLANEDAEIMSDENE